MPERCAQWLGAVVGLLSAALAAADEGRATPKPVRFELTPFAAYKFGGDFENSATGENFQLDDSPGAGLILGIPWTAESTLEIYYSHQNTDLDVAGFQASAAAVDIDLDFLHIGGTYFVDPDRTAMPYFVATVGGTRIKPSGPGTKSDTFLSFGVGGGWSFYPRERVGLRLEGRALGTLIDSNSRLFCGVNSGAGGCLVQTSGKVLWQFEAQAGVVFRF